MLRIDAHNSFGVGAIHLVCRSGGTGRRTGLKILRDLYSRTGSIPVCGIYLKSLKLYLQSLRLFSCLLQIIFHYVIIRLFKSERLEER